MGTTQMGVLNAGGMKNSDFRPIVRFFSEMIRDTAIVSSYNDEIYTCSTQVCHFK